MPVFIRDVNITKEAALINIALDYCYNPLKLDKLLVLILAKVIKLASWVTEMGLHS